MNKLLKIALILGAFGIVSAIGTYLYVFHKPHRNIEKEKPAYSLDADTFYTEFATDEDSSYQKYGNQVIEINGPVSSVSVEENTATIMLLDEMEGISCAFDSTEVVTYTDYFNELQPGAEVTIKGQCDGYDMLMGVVLTRCVIIE